MSDSNAWRDRAIRAENRIIGLRRALAADLADGPGREEWEQAHHAAILWVSNWLDEMDRVAGPTPAEPGVLPPEAPRVGEAE